MLDSCLEEKYMRYNDKLITWSKIATVLFILIVVVADIFGVWITRYVSYIWAERFDDFAVAFLATTFYIGTLGAYVILFCVYRLLKNMSNDIVFDRSNTKLMTYITAALVGIGVVCVAGGFIWNGAWFLTILALFMALIVSCVRLVFSKAIAMKEEMDLTI